MGKSLGTGPATHIASHRNPRALILVTPFTSIRECVMDILGKFTKYLIADRFRNIDKIDKVIFFFNYNFKVTCPVCYLHGKKDNIVPYLHSIRLSEKTKVGYLHISEEM